MNRKQKAANALVFALFYAIGVGAVVLTVLGVFAVAKQVF